MTEPTKLDKQLEHTIGVHVLEEASLSLIVALEEVALEADNDPRFEKVKNELQIILDLLMKTVNEALDTIPGIMTEEEAEQLVTSALKRAALLQGFAADSLLPEPEVFQ